MIAKIKKNENQLLKVLRLALITFILLAMVFILGMQNLKLNTKRTETIKRVEYLKEQVRDLEEKNIELKAKMSEAEEEDYWEGKIREQGYKKKGETQVVVLPVEGEKNLENNEEGNLFQKILNGLSNIF